tara:strand:- start:314 stop:448 length:135 start_codon:yes stop_codon:yes gene_type:complete
MITFLFFLILGYFMEEIPIHIYEGKNPKIDPEVIQDETLNIIPQ